nr:unnamed protein product [Spirometra erinaceieuropaei]
MDYAHNKCDALPEAHAAPVSRAHYQHQEADAWEWEERARRTLQAPSSRRSAFLTIVFLRAGGKEWTFQRNGRYSLIALPEPGDSSSSKYCDYVAIFNKCNELRSKLLVVHKKLKTEAQVYLESQADRHRSTQESKLHVCANENTGPRDDSLEDCSSAFEDFDGVRIRVQVECRVKTALAEASIAVRRAKQGFWNMYNSVNRIPPPPPPPPLRTNNNRCNR